MTRFLPLLWSCWFPLTVSGQSRTSGDYALTDSLDSGGGASTSGDYAQAGSVETFTETAAVSPDGAVIARAGWPGWLRNPLAPALITEQTYPNEDAVARLRAVQLNDDATMDLLPPHLVTWQPVSGPVRGIDASGLVSFNPVDRSTDAVVRGTVGAEIMELTLHVQDVRPDDFGLYANDGLPDAWQNQYFGMANPLAGPASFSDASGHTNLFKYLAKLAPGDSARQFTLTIETPAGPEGGTRLTLAPTWTDRRYTIEASSNGLDWYALTDPLPGTEGALSLTDSSNYSSMLYRVRIGLP